MVFSGASAVVRSKFEADRRRADENWRAKEKRGLEESASGGLGGADADNLFEGVG